MCMFETSSELPLWHIDPKFMLLALCFSSWTLSFPQPQIYSHLLKRHGYMRLQFKVHLLNGKRLYPVRQKLVYAPIQWTHNEGVTVYVQNTWYRYIFVLSLSIRALVFVHGHLMLSCLILLKNLCARNQICTSDIRDVANDQSLIQSDIPFLLVSLWGMDFNFPKPINCTD